MVPHIILTILILKKTVMTKRIHTCTQLDIRTRFLSPSTNSLPLQPKNLESNQVVLNQEMKNKKANIKNRMAVKANIKRHTNKRELNIIANLRNKKVLIAAKILNRKDNRLGMMQFITKSIPRREEVNNRNRIRWSVAKINELNIRKVIQIVQVTINNIK